MQRSVAGIKVGRHLKLGQRIGHLVPQKVHLVTVQVHLQQRAVGNGLDLLQTDVGVPWPWQGRTEWCGGYRGEGARQRRRGKDQGPS